MTSWRIARTLFLSALVAGGLSAGLFVARAKPVATSVPTIRVESISEDLLVSLPTVDERPSILLFWRSDCSPCRVEMRRLQEAISDGRIPGGRVFAVNRGEDRRTVESFALRTGYQFQYFLQPATAAEGPFPVRGTPTVYHLDREGKTVWSAAGLVPEDLDRAAALFLAENPEGAR